MRDRWTEAGAWIEPGDDQNIPWPSNSKAAASCGRSARVRAHRFLEHPLAPSGMEGVDLTIGGLQIGRDAGVADQHQMSPKTRPTPAQSRRGFRD
jgi:hypothetical protein